MGLILDTSLLIAAARAWREIGEFLRGLGDVPVHIAAITASELLHGCARARDAATWTRRSAYVEALLAAVPVLPFGLAEARRHAEVWAHLARAGRTIGPHDLIIAATALAQGHAVATINAREFARVPGLRVVAVRR